MPEDVEKKRERDRRYREKQKALNKDAYLSRRRENCNRSYKKKVEEMTPREKRKVRREKSIQMKQWRKKKINVDVVMQSSSEDSEKSIVDTPVTDVFSPTAKSLSASKRENEKRKKNMKILKNKCKNLQKLVWRLQYNVLIYKFVLIYVDKNHRAMK
jgi:hypothetical protein